MYIVAWIAEGMVIVPGKNILQRYYFSADWQTSMNYLFDFKDKKLPGKYLPVQSQQ